MSELGDKLRETAAACVRAAHAADGDLSTEIAPADIRAMRAAFDKWSEGSTCNVDECYRLEIAALIARGWRRPRR